MPKVKRDEVSGALIFEYEENELRENVGWRVEQLERRVERLEEEVRELKKALREFKKSSKT